MTDITSIRRRSGPAIVSPAEFGAERVPIWPAVGDHGNDHRCVNDEHVQPGLRRPPRCEGRCPWLGPRYGPAPRPASALPRSPRVGRTGTAAMTDQRFLLGEQAPRGPRRDRLGSARSACVKNTCTPVAVQPMIPVLVGVGRFELPASTSRTWRANQAALHPVSAVVDSIRMRLLLPQPFRCSFHRWFRRSHPRHPDRVSGRGCRRLRVAR